MQHIFAVRFTVTKTETHPDGSKTVTTLTVEQVGNKTYPRDWPNYNKAQVNEHRHFRAFLADPCDSLPAPAPRRGQQPLLPFDAAFEAVFKVYSTTLARRFMGDSGEAREQGFVTKVPHYNSVLDFFDTEAAAGIPHDFDARSAAPLAKVETEFAAVRPGVQQDGTGKVAGACEKAYLMMCLNCEDYTGHHHNGTTSNRRSPPSIGSSANRSGQRPNSP